MAALTRTELIDYCRTKPGAWRDEPWDDSLVVKVAEKIFAFLGAEDGHSVGLKCGRDRDEADEWLHRYPADVIAMAYLGRYGWNSFRIGDGVPDEEILDAVDASYADVVSRLPKSRRPGL